MKSIFSCMALTISALAPITTFASMYGGINVGFGNTPQNFNKVIAYDSTLPSSNRYSSTATQNVTLFYGAFVGKTIKSSAIYHVGLAAEVDIIQHNTIKGRTTADINGAADALNFNFAARSILLLARAELTRKLNKTISVTGLINLGVANNYLHHFNETVVSPTAVVLSPFRNNHQYQAAFGAGISFDFHASKRTALSLGVRYLNNGKGKFRTSTSQINGGQLQTKSLETKLLTLTLRYS